MNTIKEDVRDVAFKALSRLADERQIASDFESDIQIETPPKPEMGDVALPMFPFAKIFRIAPNSIAVDVARHFGEISDDRISSAEVAGSYVNIRVNRGYYAGQIIPAAGEELFGRTDVNSKSRVMVEFSCPNTNKPLHLGHLRNNAIGTSISRILTATGANVHKVNLINDRGIHICQSMAAYLKYGNGDTPASDDAKSDHFVGNYYVRYGQWAKEEPEAADSAARALLVKWEAGDPETIELWKTMNRWAIDGIQSTYDRTGISFDRTYHESETYTLGRDQIHAGLEAGTFYQKDDKSVWVDLEPANLDQKILLRSDGTSVYITQDVGTAIQRQTDWPFDRLIYVVAAEQEYHFAVLFEVIKKLEFEWAENLYHLSYGMVNLPEGRMKSREGTVVDADDLIDQLRELARQEIVAKEREEEIDDLEETSEAIALAAINYYLLQVTPQKDMVFDPVESIAFNGNTGPYLQYTGARIESVLRKFDAMDQMNRGGRFDPEKLSDSTEWEIIKAVALFPEAVEQAAAEYNPTFVAGYLFELAKLYSRYYHDTPILKNADVDLIASRVELSRAVRNVIKSGLALLNIKYLTKM